MSHATRICLLVLGALVLLGGIGGLAASAGQELTAPDGTRVGDLHHLNPLGSVVTIGLAVLTLVAGAIRSRSLVLLAGGLFAVGVVLVALGAERPVNPLGGSASTAGFFLGPAAALLALGLSEHAAAQAARAEERAGAPAPEDAPA